jgi:hypothetical protein
VHIYLASKPPASVLDFLKDDFSALQKRFGGVAGASFRPFPSFPQRYMERLSEQLPCEADTEGVAVEPLRVPQPLTRFTDDQILIRQFMPEASRRRARQSAGRAA